MQANEVWPGCKVAPILAPKEELFVRNVDAERGRALVSDTFSSWHMKLDKLLLLSPPLPQQVEPKKKCKVKSNSTGHCFDVGTTVTPYWKAKSGDWYCNTKQGKSGFVRECDLGPINKDA